MPTYSLIIAVSPYGYANEVMDAARKAGATGGTIINSRAIGDLETSKFMGITLREEREILITLVSNQIRDQILKAISLYAASHPDREILTLSVPASNVVGIAAPISASMPAKATDED